MRRNLDLKLSRMSKTYLMVLNFFIFKEEISKDPKENDNQFIINDYQEDFDQQDLTDPAEVILF